jgi:hypothetical protein
LIANGQRINYTSMGYRDRGLLTENGQQINYTSMG